MRARIGERSALLDGGEGWSGLPPLPMGEGLGVGLLLPQQCPVAGLPSGIHLNLRRAAVIV